MGFPSEWLPHVRPMPGYVLVERDEQEQFFAGLVEVPHSARSKVKSLKGTVFAVSQRVVEAGWPIRAGDRVVLAGGVGLRISFGHRDERTLYACRPSELIAVIVGDDDWRAEHFASVAPNPNFQRIVAAREEGKLDEAGPRK